MKKNILLLLLPFFTLTTQAQDAEANAFRKGGYARIGISAIGNKVNNSQSIRSNMEAGNFGTNIGFALEAGRIYYFAPRKVRTLVNYGLDWTIFSASYDPSGKQWKDYKKANNLEDLEFAVPAVISLKTKLGPAVSFNPAELLVIDLRAQLSAGLYLLGPEFSSDNYVLDPYNESNKGLGKIASAIKPNFGITVRRGVIGLAFDYSPGKIKGRFTESIGETMNYYNPEISANNFQATLSFTKK